MDELGRVLNQVVEVFVDGEDGQHSVTADLGGKTEGLVSPSIEPVFLGAHAPRPSPSRT